MNFKKWLLLTESKKAGDVAKELLHNDDLLLNRIKSIIPTDINQNLQVKLLPIAAFYYTQQSNIDSLKKYLLDYSNLVKLNKMPIITVKDDLTVDGDLKSYIHWTEIIDGKKHEDKVLNAPIIQGDLSDQDLISRSTDDKIRVYKANSVDQCIVLGKGEDFCISQHRNTMFQSYRDTKTSTFYFVYDNTRTDDLSIVVVDSKQDGIEITDRQNQTGRTMQDPYSTKRIDSNPNLYFKYLQEKGIDTTIFENIPKSAEEDAEHEKLGRTYYNLDWFKSLTPAEQSKYIGRGHKLSNSQFDYIYDNNFSLLLKQYTRTGLKVDNYQLGKIASKRELKDIYLHNRLIADKTESDVSKEEYYLFNQKQKEEFYSVEDEYKIEKSIQIEDFSLTKELIEKGHKIIPGNIISIIEKDRLDLLKYFVKHGAKLDKDYDFQYIAITSDSLDILRYLVDEEKIYKIQPYHIEMAFKYQHHIDIDKDSDNIDIIKYLFDEKDYKIPENAVTIAAGFGRLNALKYLIEKKHKKITNQSLYDAIIHGRFDIVKYFLDERSFNPTGQITSYSNWSWNDAIDKAPTPELKEYLVQKRAKMLNGYKLSRSVVNLA